MILVVHHFQRLRRRYRPSQQFDQIARLENDVGIGGLFGGANGHAALDQVEFARYKVLVEGGGDEGPDLAQVLFAVFGKERGEGGFFEKTSAGEGIAVGGLPRRGGPVIDGGVVPRLVAAVFVVILRCCGR